MQDGSVQSLYKDVPVYTPPPGISSSKSPIEDLYSDVPEYNKKIDTVSKFFNPGKNVLPQDYVQDKSQKASSAAAVPQEKTPLMDALTFKQSRETFGKGFDQLTKGDIVPGLLNSVLGGGEAVANLFMGIPEQAIRKLPGGAGVADIVGYPFQVVGQTISDTPGAITELLEKTGIASKLREMFPGVRIDPKTAAKYTEPIKALTAFGGQLLFGEGVGKLGGKLKEAAGIPKNLKEIQAINDNLKNRPPEDLNTDLPGSENFAEQTQTPLGEDRQLKGKTNFYVTPEGVVSEEPISIEDLKSERSQLANEIRVLRSKANISDNEGSLKKINKWIGDRQNRIDDIDEKIRPTSKDGKAVSLVLPDGSVKNFVMRSGSHKDPLAMAFSHVTQLFQDQGMNETDAMNKAEEYITSAAVGDKIDFGDVKKGEFTSSYKKVGENFDNIVAKSPDEHLITEPVHNLPEPIGKKLQDTAGDLQDEVKNASIESESPYARVENQGDGYQVVRTQKGYTINHFPQWFSNLGRSKADIIAALEKIKLDAGKDKGKLVEDLKSVIVDRLKGNEKDVFRLRVSGKDKSESLGQIPGDPEIIDFINNIDQNLTLKQFHDEYKSFEDAAKFDPSQIEKQPLVNGEENLNPSTNEQGLAAAGSEQSAVAGGAGLEEPAKKYVQKYNHTAKDVLSGKVTTPQAINEARKLLGDSFNEKFDSFLNEPNNQARLNAAKDKTFEEGAILEDFARKSVAADQLGEPDISGDLIGKANKNKEVSNVEEIPNKSDVKTSDKGGERKIDTNPQQKAETKTDKNKVGEPSTAGGEESVSSEGVSSRVAKGEEVQGLQPRPKGIKIPKGLTDDQLNKEFKMYSNKIDVLTEYKKKSNTSEFTSTPEQLLSEKDFNRFEDIKNEIVSRESASAKLKVAESRAQRIKENEAAAEGKEKKIEAENLFGEEGSEAKVKTKVKPAEDPFLSSEMNKPEFRTDKGIAENKPGKGEENLPLFNQKKSDPGQLELESSLVPGLKQFINEDVKPTFENSVTGFKKTIDSVLKLFSPASRGAEAKLAASLLRKRAAELAYKKEIAAASLDKMRKFYLNQSDALNLKRIIDAEHGRYEGTPAEIEAMKTMQESLKKKYTYILETKGGEGSFIENYFPHFWKDPEKVSKVISDTYRKSPLEGTRGFLKKRSLPTTQDGMDLGFQPVSANPVELYLLKNHEMDKWIMAHDLWKDFKENKLLKFNRIGEKRPVGYGEINDRMGTVFGNPALTIPEYFDRIKMEKLEELASSLGADHQRLNKLKGGVLGYFSAPNEIKTRFATPLNTLTHEIGHYIDETYGLADRFVKDPRSKVELRKLADLRDEGQLENRTDSRKAYVRKGAEKMANMIDAYVNTPDKFKEVAPTTYKMLQDFISQHSELQQLNEIENTLTRGMSSAEFKVPGLLIHGKWLMPQIGADIVNNYLSPGLGNNPFYQLFRKSGNTLNSVQLGLSAFHGFFTTIDAITSKHALGIQKISQGRLLSGAGDLAQVYFASPYVAYKNLVNGNRLLKAYYGKNPELAHYVQAIIEAGGRVRMDKFYTNNAVASWSAALRKGNLPGAIVRTPGALIEALAKPLMQEFVPRQKLGVFFDMAKNIYEEAARKNWDAQTTRYRLQEAWDSVDNRMGQLVYDNLFWNKALKDLGMASVRSLGWNLGDIRELGGAPLDVAMQLKSAVTGKGFRVTPKMAYALSLPVVTGLAGAMIGYMYTGQGPQELKDYFFPKTGKKLPDGTDERMQLPTYMKDVYAYGIQPLTTLGHKLHPLLSAFVNMIKNEDYYGYEINDQNFWTATKQLFTKANSDPMYEFFKNEFEYLGSQFVPFTVKGIMQREKTGTEKGITPESFAGINPAPKYISNTSAQNQIESLYQDRFGGNSKPKDQLLIDEAKRSIRKALQLQDKTKAQNLINDAVDKGYFEPNSQVVKNMMKSSGQSFDKFAFSRLSPIDQSSMIDNWNDADVDKYLPMAGKDVYKTNPDLVERAYKVKADLEKQIAAKKADHVSDTDLVPLYKELKSLMLHVAKGSGIDITKPLKDQKRSSTNKQIE